MSEATNPYITSRNFFNAPRSPLPDKTLLEIMINNLVEEANKTIGNPAIAQALRLSLQAAKDGALKHQKLFSEAYEQHSHASALHRFGEAQALMQTCNFHYKQITAIWSFALGITNDCLT